MASSWYKGFKNKLDDINVRSVANDPLKNANLVARSAGLKDFAPWNPNPSPSGIIDHLGDWGGKALDIISRPGYATGSFLNSILEDTVDDTPGVDFGDAFVNAGEGLTGKRKEFFKPSEILDPYEEGQNWGETSGKFILDLLAAVATDPVSYIPGAAIARGAKGVGSVTGVNKVLSKINESTKPAMSPTMRAIEDTPVGVATPEEVATKGIAVPDSLPVTSENTGKVVVNEQAGNASFINDLLASGNLGGFKADTPVYANPAVHSLANSLKTNLKAVGKGTHKNDQLAAMTILRGSIADTLRNVRGKLLQTKPESPWVDVPNTLPKPKSPTFKELVKPTGGTVEEIVPGTSMLESARNNAYMRYVRENALKAKTPAAAEKMSLSPKNKDVDVWDGTDFWINGERINYKQGLTPGTFADDAAWKEFTGSEGVGLNSTEGFPTPGGSLGLDQYVNALLGKPSKLTETGTVQQGDELVPWDLYAQSRQEKWAGRTANSKTTVESPVDPKAMAKYERDVARQEAAQAAFKQSELDYISKELVPDRARPDKIARTEWVASHSDIIPAEDLKKLDSLLRQGKEESFTKYVDKLMQKEGRLDIESLDALDAAVKSGRVSKDEAKAVYQSFGAETAGEAKKRLESIQKRMDDLKAAVDLNPDTRGAINSVREMTPHDIAKVGEVPRKIPKSSIPIKELRTLKLDNRSYTRASAKSIIESTTTPEVAAALSVDDSVMLIENVKRIIDSQWNNPRQWKYRTNRGALRTHNEPNIGNARWYGEFNRHSQYTLLKGMIGVARKDLPKDLKGYRRGEAMYNKVLPLIKAQEDMLRAYGVHPSLIEGGKGLPISTHDILSSLPKKFVIDHVFNSARQITHEQLTAIAEEALHFSEKTLDDFRDTVNLMLQGGAEGTGTMNAFGHAAHVGARAGKSVLEKAVKKDPDFATQGIPENIKRQSVIVGQAMHNKVFGQTLDGIASAEFIEAIKAKAAYNSDRIGIQYGEFVQKASSETIQKFIDDIDNVVTQDEIFSIIENTRAGVTGFVKDTADIVPPPHALSDVKDKVDLATTNPATEVALKGTKEYAKATTKNERVGVGTKISESVDDEVSDMFPEFDFSDRVQLSMNARVARSMTPHMAEGPLRQLLLAGQNFSRMETEQFTRGLSKLEKAVGKEQAVQLFKDVQQGLPPQVNEATELHQLHQVISRIFDSSGSGFGLLQREGIEPAHLNANLRHFKLDVERYGLKGSTAGEAYDSWRNWGDVEDPLNILSKYHAAVQKTLSEKTFGEHISMHFGSDTFKKGYGKITTSSGKSRIAHLVNTNKYYPIDIIKNMKMMDETLRELAKPGTDNKFLQIFDSVTHKYKTGLTIYRPGHHMRNMYGDIWLGFMDGVNSPKFYNQARKIMGTRNSHYSKFETELDLSDLADSKGRAASLKINGSQVHLTNDDVYRLAYKSGMYPGYSVLEDLGIATNAGDKVGGFKPFNGKAHAAATGLSEYRDHYVRTAHLLSLLDRTKGITAKRLPNESMSAFHARVLDDKFLEYSARVRKWHPDGSDLSHFERNVMRRGVLFYSWIRKAIPLVIESFFIKPGRFLAFPKAMYALAEANGVDLNGFSDPFPTDQLFPSWMGGNQGPQFGNASAGYLGLKMGVPIMDILDQYFTNPGNTLQTMAGAVHPGIKIPMELATGSTTEGVPIKDLGKYALGQVPFGNLVNTTLGKPIGGVSAADEDYSPQGLVRNPEFLAWLNTMTGLGLTDMSKPSLIKSGEFDAKYGRTAS